jgi:hypothetical protein
VAGSALSRRVSEVLGVVQFALALVWPVAVTPSAANDAVWFFDTGGRVPPVNFVGRVGAFLAELSYQVFGFASYAAPAVLVASGWQYFWCRRIEAVYTKTVGITLMFGCTASFLSLASPRSKPQAKPSEPAATSASGWPRSWRSTSIAPDQSSSF